jgi:NADH-quinone oxidoreductase subunit K
MMVSLQEYLTVSAALLALGIFGVLTRKNAVSILMGIELILNSANLNFIAFNKFTADGISGNVFAIFVILLAAAEAAVALAIILALYRSMRSIEVDKADAMKW